MVPDLDADEVKRLWREAPNGGGLIFVVGHVGNNEAVAAAIARHEMPISVVADDSSFPEIFEILRRQREAWGVRIIAWRNLRAIFGVLRRREMLGLLVDWGYRSDGIPVRLFGAVDRAAGRSRDARREDRLAHPADHDPAPPRRHLPRDLARADRPRVVRSGRTPARHPGDGRRARLDDRRRPGPVVQLQADLAGDRRGGRRPRAAGDADAGGHRRPGAGAGVRLTVAGIVGAGCASGPLLAASWLACRLPGAARSCGSPSSAGDVWYRADARSGGPGAPEPAARRRGPGGARSRARALARAAADDPRALERLVRLAYRPRRALLPRGRPGARHCVRATSTSRSRSRRRTPSPTPSRPGRAVDLRRAPLRGHRAAGDAARDSRRRRRRADGDGRRSRPAGLVRAHPRRGRGAHRRAARGTSRAAGRAAGRDERRARRGPRPDRRRHADRAVRCTRACCRSARRCWRSRAARRSRRRRPAGRGRALLGRLEPVDRARGRHPPRARDRDDGRHRARIRAHHGGRPRAVVGGVLPDLAGPGACGGDRRDRRPGRAAT